MTDEQQNREDSAAYTARKAEAPRDDYDALTATIRELVKVMREGGIGRLEIRRGDLEISLRSHEPAGASAGAPAPVSAAPVGEEGEAVESEAGYIITSPMIGTYYASPSPGERPFVSVGDSVEAGQTVAIIEAMKIMNEITSERSGVVEEIYVTNGEAVEYGHRLMRLRLTD